MHDGMDSGRTSPRANEDAVDGGEFNLVKYYSLVCFALFVVITTVMCTGFYHISKRYIRLDAEHRAVPIAERLALLAFVDGKPLPPLGTEEYSLVDGQMRDMLSPLRIFKIKIYDTDGRIVYTTDSRIPIGRLDVGNDKLTKALAGGVVSELQSSATVWDLEEEEKSVGVVVETYVPVSSGSPTGDVQGVLEIYQDVSTTYARLPDVIALIVVASVLAMGALYGILYLVVRKADRIIREQTRTIQSAKADLEKHASQLECRVEERTRQLRDTLAEQRHDEKMVAMGTLAAGVAHELNTPLGSILGSAQLVLDHCSSVVEGASEPIHALGTPAGCRQCLEDLARIESQTRRCKEIISDLVGFSRKSGGESSWEDLQTLVEQSISLVEPEARRCRIVAALTTAGALPPMWINGDEIQQVLVNVMNNAIAAMPDGGTLDVRLSRCDRKARIEIQDTGTGIDDTTLGRIFEPFFTTKDAGKGTGLGLSISYRIIKDYSGNISVRSAVGQGSTFIIEIPLGSAQAGSCDDGDGANVVRADTGKYEEE